MIKRMTNRIDLLVGNEALLKGHMIAGDHFLYCLCICKVCLNGSLSITSIASLNPQCFGSRGCATISGGVQIQHEESFNEMKLRSHLDTFIEWFPTFSGTI